MENKKRSLATWLRLMRCSQWIKNIFVFFPLFFGHQIDDLALTIPCLYTALLFCPLSSAMYCLNDIMDRKTDRFHPVKRFRPIASGLVSVTEAFTVMAICLIVAFAGCLLVDLSEVLPVFVIYVALNVLYSTLLKKIAIVDILVLSLFYIIRLIAGSVATGIENSSWIILMTFLLTLLLGLGKRRDDMLKTTKTGHVLRSATSHYSMPYVTACMMILSGVTIVCYIMYTLSEEIVNRVGSRYLYTTGVFVLASILRYMWHVLRNQEIGDPTYLLLHDHIIQVCIMCWLCSFAILLYG